MKKPQLTFIKNVLIYYLFYFKIYEINYHQIKYENVISNFKKEISDLLKFLNLEFEENMNFHKTALLRENIKHTKL